MPSGDELRHLTRDQLVARAQQQGVPNAERMTRDGLIAALGPTTPSKRGGWLGRARDLVARVVEQGLHLPEAASMLRGVSTAAPHPPPPLPTVTLAEIYAAQGHREKAVAVLDEVLSRDPEHQEARSLRARYTGEEEVSEELPSTEPAEVIIVPEPAEAAEMMAETISPPPTLRTRDTDAPEPPASFVASHIVCLATDPTSLFVYWEVRPLVFARARWRDSRGRLVLRLVSVTANLTDVRGDERDIDVEGLAGERFIRGLTPDAEVRLCIAWLGPRGFVPLAVAAEVKMPRDYPVEPEAHREADAEVAARWRDRVRGNANVDGLDATAGSSPLRLARANFASVDVGRAPQPRDSTLFGGASDLQRGAFGGASDLVGGASDLYRSDA